MKTLNVCLLLSAALLTGCATTAIDPQLCGAADWEKVGWVDGREGRPLSYKQEHTRSCKGREPLDPIGYDRGWEKGQLEYCTVANAHEVGLWGRPFNSICPKEREKELLEAHSQGAALLRKRSELQEMEKKIAEEKERRDKDESVVNHISQAYHLLAGTSPTQGMENQAAQMREDMNRLEAGAPPRISTPAFEQGMRQAYDTFGAVVGLVAGFGSGHAIQGRYKTDGWKWTVGEAAMIGSMIVVSRSECPVNERPSGDINAEPARCASSWPMVTMLAWLGFRVWQTVDLFGHDGSSRYAVGVSPQGLQVVYNF